MKKLLLSLLFLSSLISSEISTVLKVKKLDDKTIITTEAERVRVGESALIIRELSTGDKLIGFSCEVTKAVSTMAVLSCEKFEGLAQDAMPVISFDAKVGDIVVLNPLSNRALIIAKSLDGYLKTKQEFKNYQLVHPDLLAITLFNNDNPFPKKEDFKNFCDEYYISNIIFDFSTTREIVNCQTFKMIDSFEKKRGEGKEIMKPFFHRLAKIETSFWDFGKEEIDSFDTYYKGVIDAN